MPAARLYVARGPRWKRHACSRECIHNRAPECEAICYICINYYNHSPSSSVHCAYHTGFRPSFRPEFPTEALSGPPHLNPGRRGRQIHQSSAGPSSVTHHLRHLDVTLCLSLSVQRSWEIPFVPVERNTGIRVGSPKEQKNDTGTTRYVCVSVRTWLQTI